MNPLEIASLARREARAKVVEAIALFLPLESVAASLADNQGFATNSKSTREIVPRCPSGEI